MIQTIYIPNRIFTISDVLSPGECAEYITLTENLGYTPAGLTTGRDQYLIAPNVRNNDRIILDDPERAANLWHRVAKYVPATIDKWTAIGLNNRLRFYRYEPGQRFAPHSDGRYRRENGEVSQLTLLIYLNDGFEGGETRFYLHCAPFSQSSDLSVVPKAGMALCFLHQVLHEGASVIRGSKYVLRSDVMYAL